MEVDRLPSGRQDRRLGTDINGIVGMYNVLMLCFDASRYDVNVAKEASGRTPALNSYGSGWEKRHVPDNFTYSSHFAIFAGLLPSPAELRVLRSQKWLLFPFQAGTGHIPPGGSYAFKEATFVQGLSNIDYKTICIGGVSFSSRRSDIGGISPGYFNKSCWLPAFGCTDRSDATDQVDFAVNKLEKHPADRKVFIYINFSTIHYPNYHYVESKEEDNKESHAVALRYVDSQLPHLFETFRKCPDTLVIVLSDHSICYGKDGCECYYISHEKVYAVPYKHFVLRK